MAGEGNGFAGERTVRYLLLNKDVVIAEFEVDTVYDDITIVKQYVELPDWFGNLDSFIIKREYAKAKREYRRVVTS